MSSPFVFRAKPVAVPAGGLVIPIGENRKPTSGLPFPGHFDVCPTWLELALRHLSDAKVAQAARIAAWDSTDENSKAAALEWEFEASLQAIMASAIAIEAFGAAAQAIVQPPRSLLDEWQEKRIPRQFQIAEVLRRAFSLEQKNALKLGQNLGEIFRFRDLAIDPSGKGDAPILHPGLGVGVEWRFVYFRYANALLIVKVALRLIWELVVSDIPRDADVQRYIDALRVRIQPLQDSNVISVLTNATDTPWGKES